MVPWKNKTSLASRIKLRSHFDHLGPQSFGPPASIGPSAACATMCYRACGTGQAGRGLSKPLGSTVPAQLFHRSTAAKIAPSLSKLPSCASTLTAQGGAPLHRHCLPSGIRRLRASHHQHQPTFVAGRAPPGDGRPAINHRAIVFFDLLINSQWASMPKTGATQALPAETPTPDRPASP